MYIKISDTSLGMDSREDTWLFFARGRDGSTYIYNTFASIAKKDKTQMFKHLKELVREGLINRDHWRLV